jgi:hypothetical protein
MDAIDRAHDAHSAPFAWDTDLQFAPRPDAARALRTQRVFATVFVVALHVLFAWLLEWQSHPRIEVTKEEVVVAVDFIATLPPETIHAPERADTPSPDARPVATRPPRTEPTRNLPSRPIDAVVREAPPLSLYRPDGSLRIPDEVLAKLEDNAGDDRQFDFQHPDLERAGHWLDRPPALVYEETRFEKYWKPNETLLDQVLRKAVEKTTKEVRIPIPGAPGRELVCVVSILAAGGACGVERYGSDIPRPGIDDPATLDANEAAACQAWWDRIVGATTQAEWRRTKHLYEEECRKPLAKELSKPPEPVVDSAPAAAQ